MVSGCKIEKQKKYTIMLVKPKIKMPKAEDEPKPLEKQRKNTTSVKNNSFNQVDVLENSVSTIKPKSGYSSIEDEYRRDFVLTKATEALKTNEALSQIISKRESDGLGVKLSREEVNQLYRTIQNNCPELRAMEVAVAIYELADIEMDELYSLLSNVFKKKIVKDAVTTYKKKAYFLNLI